MINREYDRYSGLIAGAVLIIISGCIWFIPHLERLSEALLIAGILTCTVDPFLKRRIIKESAKDIFQHLMGFDLPADIREKLRQLVVETKSYRTNMRISVALAKNSEGVLVDIKINSTVTAASNTEYRQGLSGENKERIELLEASVTSNSNPALSYAIKDGKCNQNPDEPGVFEWKGKRLKLKKGDVVTSYIHYTVQKELSDFYILYFGAPVISPTLYILEHPGLEAHASKADQQNGAEYSYQRVFLVGDHLNVRWWPQISN